MRAHYSDYLFSVLFSINLNKVEASSVLRQVPKIVLPFEERNANQTSQNFMVKDEQYEAKTSCLAVNRRLDALKRSPLAIKPLASKTSNSTSTPVRSILKSSNVHTIEGFPKDQDAISYSPLDTKTDESAAKSTEHVENAVILNESTTSSAFSITPSRKPDVSMVGMTQALKAII